MALRTDVPSLVAALADQFRVPERWDVVPNARLAAGWLGSIETSLALLAPGPERSSAHRAQLVVFVLPDPSSATGETVSAQVQLAAAADIPEAWLIDALNAWTEVYRAPYDGRYRSRCLCYPGEALHPLALSRTKIVPIAGIRSRCAR